MSLIITVSVCVRWFFSISFSIMFAFTHNNIWHLYLVEYVDFIQDMMYWFRKVLMRYCVRWKTCKMQHWGNVHRPYTLAYFICMSKAFSSFDMQTVLCEQSIANCHQTKPHMLAKEMAWCDTYTYQLQTLCCIQTWLRQTSLKILYTTLYFWELQGKSNLLVHIKLLLWNVNNNHVCGWLHIE